MARVPVYSGPQVETAALPNARQQIATPDDAFGAVQNRQVGQLAKAANTAAQAFEQAQIEADQTRVDDALNQLRETELDLTFNPEQGYTNLKGVNALQRPDGKPLTEEYFGKLNGRRGEIAASLGNDRQRMAFERRASDRLTAFRGNLMNYEGDQFRNYQLSVAEGTVGTATQQIAQFYNDPGKINDGVLSIQSAVAKQGRIQGLSAEQIKLNSEKLVSAAHMGAIAQAMGQGPAGVMQAEQYLRTYKDQMTPQDLLKARGVVDEQAATIIGESMARNVVGMVGATNNPDDFSRMTAITMETESGGRRYGPDGKTLLTSSAGAKGEMQVMDATNRDPGFGVTPARDNSPEERARVGRDYLGALLKHYDGNPALMWAAYNGGPGALDKAMAKAKSEGNPGNWLSYMPAETRDYVAKSMRKFQEGGGKPAPLDYDTARRELLANPELQSRPLAMKKALAAFETEFGNYEKGQKRIEAAAFNEGLAAIQSGQNFDQLPTDLVNRIKPEDRERLRKFDDKTDLDVYQLLSRNPDRVRNMPDEEFNKLRADLSEADFKKFADLRGKSGSGKAGEKGAPGTLDMTGIAQVLKPRLTAIGLDASKASDKERIGAISMHLHDRILSEQARIGRQLTDAEAQKFIDHEFLRTRAFKESGWFASEGVRKESLFGMTIGDIPKDSVATIKADLAAQGITKPTNQQVLKAYYESDARFPNTR